MLPSKDVGTFECLVSSVSCFSGDFSSKAKEVILFTELGLSLFSASYIQVASV